MSTSHLCRRLILSSTKHLAKSSCKPVKTNPDVPTLYNMRFCPYAQRSVMVLVAKNISFDLVNIDLINKPDWFISFNSNGLVPAIEYAENKMLCESMIICNYLDDVHRNNPMYNADKFKKANEQLLIYRFDSSVAKVFKKILFADKEERKTLFLKNVKILSKFENELRLINGNFFGGNEPNMVDYCIWPWFERCDVFYKLFDKKSYQFPFNDFPKLTAWMTNMLALDSVKFYYLPTELHAEFLKSLSILQPEYDIKGTEI